MTDAIQEASKETIPSKTKKEIDKPWTNHTYQELTHRHRMEKDPVKKKSLSYELRKLRTELKNAYFKAKADKLNFASQQRDNEEEFRLMKQYTSLPRLNSPLIAPQQLEEHSFSAHFNNRAYEPQPELEQPENYPHILPPDDLPEISILTPNHAEVENSMKRLKNGKYQGIDKAYAEQLKYPMSMGLLNYILLLI